jgi:hypothetical protein
MVAAIIAIVFFYVANASETVDTLISWTCSWQLVNMTQNPHFGTMCKQSQAGLYLAIVLIPVEALALALAGWQLKVEKYTSAYTRARKGSPATS